MNANGNGRAVERTEFLKQYSEICRERAAREKATLEQLQAALDLVIEIPEPTWKQFVELESNGWVN
jgi:hypothetical protein